jgi:Regulator of chromosome condensation (RCC1) repeat
VLVASQSALCPDARGDYPFQIGAMTTSSYFFTGDIAEIQIYNRALTSLEVMSVNEMLSATYGINGAAGTVVVWGNNASGQTNVPVSLTNVTAVAGGNAFNLALKANGSVVGWGENSQGQTTIPAGLTNVSAISGGANFSLAIGNQPPIATNEIISGFVNHDILLALPAVSPDGVPLNFRIQSLPATGALYQFSGGTRGLPITATGTTVSDAGGQIIFAPVSAQTGSPYVNFNFNADDGMFTSSTAQVTVNMVLPAGPQITGAVWNSGGAGAENFGLNFSGSSNATYDVWAGTNLVDWVKIGSANEAPAGVYQFIDPGVTNWPARFYRVSAGQ